MPLLGEEGQGRGLAGHDPARGLVGSGLAEVPPLLRHLRGVGEGVHHQARQHLGAHRVGLELERGDDAQVAAAARRPQKRSGSFFALAVTTAAVGQDHVGREQVVHGEAVLAADPAEAPAEGQPGDAGGGVDARRDREAEGLGLVVEVAEGGPGPGADGPRRRVHPHVPHPGEVDHQPAVTGGLSRDVVPRAAHREEQVVLPGQLEAVDHVGGARAPGDQRGTAVDHRVPEGADLVVPASSAVTSSPRSPARNPSTTSAARVALPPAPVTTDTLLIHTPPDPACRHASRAETRHRILATP